MQAAGQLDSARGSLKWITDFLINAHAYYLDCKHQNYHDYYHDCKHQNYLRILFFDPYDPDDSHKKFLLQH